jgi:large subunit ribosomal protein L4e
MKAKILDINGKEKESIELPDCFSQPIREDIIAKVLETKKTKQPYSPSPVAGKQYSAKGKLKHLRHVWKSQYGRGISRVPRKIISRRGSQFNWEAAEAPQTRGGMRAHPPKVISMINTKKINKKEMTLAFASALSATADEKKVVEKYKRIEKLDKSLPLIIESKIVSLKTKELILSLKKILGDNLFELAIKKKKIRAGKGKTRGRKYKSNAGMLLVLGEKEKIKTGAFEVKSVKNLAVSDLARGGLGRLTLYTEQSIKELGKRFKEK